MLVSPSHNHYKVTNGLLTQDKTKPYRSTKYVRIPAELNGKVVNQSGDPVVCRHFAADFIINEQKAGKVYPHKLYGSRAIIRSHFSTDLEAEYKSLKNESREIAISPCQNFGKLLHNQFQGMEPGSQKLFLLESTNHTMALVLKTEFYQNDYRYVIQLYDPNNTDSITNCKIVDLDSLLSGQYELKNFFEPQQYAAYFGAHDSIDEEKEYLLYDCTDAHHEGIAPKTFTSETESAAGISATMLKHMLLDEFQLDQKNIESFKCLPVEMQRQMLVSMMTVRDSDKQLLWASGSKRRFQTLGQLLAIVSEKDRLSVLKELKLNFNFLTFNRSGAHAFRDLILMCPMEDREQLFVTHLPQVISSLIDAINKNDHSTIESIVMFVKETMQPPGQFATFFKGLLTAKDKAGAPLLFNLLQKNDKNCITSYGELVSLGINSIPENERKWFLMEIMEAKHLDGTSGPFIAFEKNNVDAIAAYVAILGEVLLAIPNEQHPSILSQLLLSTNNEGVTGPFRAYQKNNLSVVNACMQSLIACRNVNSGTFFKQFANEKSKYKDELNNKQQIVMEKAESKRSGPTDRKDKAESKLANPSVHNSYLNAMERDYLLKYNSQEHETLKRSAFNQLSEQQKERLTTLDAIQSILVGIKRSYI